MIRIAPDPQGAPLRAPWKQGIAMGRAYELLRADAQEHLRFVQRALGFQWCRFHGLFHEDMAVVTRRAGGELLYQWAQVDKVFDFLLSIGLRPFVELNPMPFALAAGPSAMFAWKMNVSQPRSYAEWGALIEAFARHCIDRYGLEEVRRWHFEVWNEPNLSAFWKGTREDYWKLYDASAFALRNVDPQLRVGGPATARGEWVPELIAHCAANGVPLDFITTHGYPQDEFVAYLDPAQSPFAPGEYFSAQVRRVRAEIAGSARPDLPVFWTEWNSLACSRASTVSWIHNRSVDDLGCGAAVARYALELDGESDGMAWWVASDVFEEAGLPMSPFSETYGLVTIHGIPKPSFHAFTFLARLQGPMAAVETASPLANGCGIIATAGNGVFRAVLYNHQPPSVENPAMWCDVLSFAWPGEAALALSATVRKGAGSAREMWEELGSPHGISPMEECLLRSVAAPVHALERLEAKDGFLQWNLRLEPNEVAYLEIRTPGLVYNLKGAHKPEAQNWDAGMGVGASDHGP